MAPEGRTLVLAVMWVILLTRCDATFAQGFEVTATLQSGRTITGQLSGESWVFDAIAVSKQPVRVRVQKPPEWSSAKVASEIEWIPERRVFVIRDVAWTGELERLWDTLTIYDKESKPVVIPGNEVKHIRFLYVGVGKKQ